MTSHGLQREGAIRYRRGLVTVCDRGLLLAGACECCRAVEERACWFLAEAPAADFGAGA
jgi:hypothetical protein